MNEPHELLKQLHEDNILSDENFKEIDQRLKLSDRLKRKLVDIFNIIIDD